MDRSFDECNTGCIVLYFCNYNSDILLLKRLIIINTCTDTFTWKKDAI